MDYRQIQVDRTDKVCEIIQSVISKYISDVRATPENRHMAIRVANEDWSLNFWIRTNSSEDNASLDFATIELPEQYRHKGIMTSVFEELKKYDWITYIQITSVLTDEMRSWCKKNNLKVIKNSHNMNYMWSR